MPAPDPELRRMRRKEELEDRSDGELERKLEDGFDLLDDEDHEETYVDIVTNQEPDDASA
jgi:hypothetical protein